MRLGDVKTQRELHGLRGARRARAPGSHLSSASATPGTTSTAASSPRHATHNGASLSHGGAAGEAHPGEGGAADPHQRAEARRRRRRLQAGASLCLAVLQRRLPHTAAMAAQAALEEGAEDAVQQLVAVCRSGVTPW